jgi:hypothetical protein
MAMIFLAIEPKDPPIHRKEIPSGYLTVCHGKSRFFIGKPSLL